MPEAQDQFSELLRQVHRGSEDATRELIELYGPHIYRTVRRRLSRKLRQKFDSADFVQAVWLSFFEHSSALVRLESPEQLVALLARIASNKVVDECRRRLILAKHNVNCERSLDRSAAIAAARVPADVATPSQFAVAHEQWEQMVAGQPSHYVRMAELRADGSTYGEIASKLGVDEKTVRRTMQRLGKRLRR